MFAVIMFFGALIAGMGLWGFTLPNSFIALLQRFACSAQGIYWIVGSRIALGCLLVMAAPVSHYPVLFYTVGVLSLFGALVSMMLGAENIERYMNWWVERPAICLRLIMLLAWLLGVLLIYAAWISL